MGSLKDQMVEYDQLGFSKPDDELNVCSNHFSDYAIIEYINENQEENLVCSFCDNTTSKSVISLDKFMRLLSRTIYYFFDDADNHLSYADKEDDEIYVGDYYDKSEVLEDLLGIETDYEVNETILDLLDDRFYCKKDPYSLDEDEELIYEWNKFADLIKHRVRYTFFQTKFFDKEDYPVSSILNTVCKNVIDLNLVKELDKGSRIFRSRQHFEGLEINSIKELGTPSLKDCVLSNRMSPSGIPMFYGAFDPETAEMEVVDLDSLKKVLSTAEFRCNQKLNVIDLSSLLPLPSYFDDDHRHTFFSIRFLNSFISEISKSIERNTYEHIEYVPTQVLTEYFRYVIPETLKVNVNGIIYPSAKSKDGKCIVLFFDQKKCLDELELVNISQKKLL